MRYKSALSVLSPFFFFFNDTATTEIYTLSLHDALPICDDRQRPADRATRRLEQDQDEHGAEHHVGGGGIADPEGERSEEHTSESSHANISYAVFCLKKKKNYPHTSKQPQHLCTTMARGS